MPRRLLVLWILFSIFFSLISPLTLKAKEQKEYKIFNESGTNGMFSIFSVVTGLLHRYDQGYLAGVKVDFGTNGVYYDEQVGPNWWNYYCESIEVGDPTTALMSVCLPDDCGNMAWVIERQLSKLQVYVLIKKYIKVKSVIQNKVKTFLENNMKDHFVIGVHYRGTDKITEGPRLDYSQVAERVIEYAKTEGKEDFKIFIATDEAPFLDYMISIFAEKVICLPAFRTTKNEPIHQVNDDPYKQGEEAIIDCLLLSQCQILFRTTSNLSLWSTFFNPFLPVIVLSNRYDGF